MSAEAKPIAVEPLWTVRDVMAYLRRSERWVYGHADQLGAIREFGGLRFDPAAIRARAQGGRVVPFLPRR